MVLSRGKNDNEVEGGGGNKKGYEITVAAKHMPGDNDVEYTSPWAGADYLPLVVIKHTSYAFFFFFSFLSLAEDTEI